VVSAGGLAGDAIARLLPSAGAAIAAVMFFGIAAAIAVAIAAATAAPISAAIAALSPCFDTTTTSSAWLEAFAAASSGTRGRGRRLFLRSAEHAVVVGGGWRPIVETALGG